MLWHNIGKKIRVGTASASRSKNSGESAFGGRKQPDLLSGNTETGCRHKGGNHHQNQRQQAVLTPATLGFDSVSVLLITAS